MVGINDELKRPQVDEIEVTLLSGSLTYGECIVVHYGQNNWMIIDSCINSYTGNPIAVDYLEDIGVDVSASVKYVVCSHLHDDHINGLDVILRKCSGNAVFVIPSVGDIRTFLMVSLLEERTITGEPQKYKILRSCLKAVKDKNINVIAANQNHIISSSEGLLSLCCALSPTPHTEQIEKAKLAQTFERMCNILRQKQRLDSLPSYLIEESVDIEADVYKFLNISDKDYEIVVQPKISLDIETESNDQNSYCVALLLKMQKLNIILGADLENGTTANDGWLSVDGAVCMRNVKANYFKIPHHGSINGFNALFMKNHILSDNIMTVSCYKRKSFLPRQDMLERYKSYSKNIYATNVESETRRKINDISRADLKIMQKFVDSIEEEIPNIGIIRSRVNSSIDNPVWDTMTFGSAIKVS
jgi:beta-lactamase superfamily II metal-dependent hydrolase